MLWKGEGRGGAVWHLIFGRGVGWLGGLRELEFEIWGWREGRGLLLS